MALAQRKRVILVKLEPTYGTDSSPVAADAVLCSGLDITPLEGSSVERDFIRPYFGGSGSIRVENFVSLSFDTEIAGSGTAATPPEWGALLKAANFSETITAAPITATGQVGGSTTTIKLAAGASAVDDFYTGMTLSITGGTGTGNAPAEIISYVGSTKMATFAKAVTTVPDATSVYSIGANVMYLPNSNFGTATANTSASIYFNVDGVRHVLLGARGTPSFDLSVKTIPKIKWKFTGMLGTISDQTLPTADFTGWQTPVTVSTANTTDINLLGYNGAVVQTLNFDIANTLVYGYSAGELAAVYGKTLPGFATGGAHVGGWRIVGENGPELERTGPSHIFSNSQSKSLVDNSELIAEIKALREEVKAGQEAIAMNTRQTTKILRDVTQDGTSITTSVAA